MNIIKSIITTLILFLYSITGHTQEKGFQKDQENRNLGLHLRGRVKSVKMEYSPLRPGLSAKEKFRVYNSNDVCGDDNYVFNEHGNIIAHEHRNRDTGFNFEHYVFKYYRVYNDGSYPERNNYEGKRKPVYPAFDETLMHVSYVDSPDARKITFTYIYDTLGRIKEAHEVHLYKKFSGELIKGYSYDRQGNLKRIDCKTNSGEFLNNIIFMGLHTSFCYDSHVDFDYDSLNRVTKMVMTSCQRIVVAEEYHYDPASSDFITKINRYVGGMSKYPAPNMEVYYNKSGDIVQVHFVSRTPLSQPADRYYDYDYDNNGNWVKCRMYLEGNKTNLTATANRNIIYYN